MSSESLVEKLREDARAADELHERSRRILVETARAAAAAGMTQREISNVIRRSQPEVSRLLRFHGRSPLGRVLEKNRAAVLRALSSAGAQNPRVFGSVSRGDDKPGSDVDIMVDFPTALSLFALARLERELSDILGAPVDVVRAKSLLDNIAPAALREAIPL
jgi:hypothetical protein